MLSPDQLQDAGDLVASIYTEMEAKMLDHLVSSLLNVNRLDQQSYTELNLLSQSLNSKLREVVEEHRGAISDAVYETCEKYLSISDKDDVARLGEGELIFPQQLTATVVGMQLVCDRDNLKMVESAKQTFLKTSIEAVTKVNSGLYTTEQALHSAVRQIERDGIPLITYRNTKTGKVTVQNKIDVAVRRHIRTQIAQDSGRMTMDRLNELDVALVEVSSHEGARPTHQAWEGRCYSLHGDITIDGKRYPDFYSSTGYGQVDGLLGANCRHSFGPYRHGAKRAYHPDPKSATGLSNDEIYELTQKQRYIERLIREDKRELRGAQQEYNKDPTLTNKTNLLKAQERLRNRQEGMRAFIAESNAKCKKGTTVLTRNPRREWAGDMPKTIKKTKIRAMEHREPLVKIKDEMNGFSVSKVVNTSSYHKAFENLPVSKNVAQSAYKTAGKILERADGKNEEYQAAIDARTGQPITDNLDRQGTSGKTYFIGDEITALNNHEGNVVVLHNHPHSGAPSYRDVLTAAKNDKIQGSIVVGHDGSIWYFSGVTQAIAEKLESAYNTIKDALGDKAEIVALDNLISRSRKEGFIWKKIR